MIQEKPQVEAIKQRYEMLVGRINERQLREFAGVEAKVFGRGGVRAVARFQRYSAIPSGYSLVVRL